MKEFVGLLVILAVFAVAALFLCSVNGLGAVGITAPRVHPDMNALSDQLTTWTMVVVGACLAAALAWWAMGMYMFKAGRGEEGRWGTYWWLLMILPIVAAICAIFLEPTADGNVTVLMGFDVFGGVLFYWLSTAMFSPALTKHVPPVSRSLRLLP